MRSILFIVLITVCSAVWADSVKVEISPSKPVSGEVFQAVFRIFTNADEEPSINFTPFRVEVVGKTNQGIKTSTVYANGQFSTSREMTIVYELAAGSQGIAGLRDITVQVGDKTLRHPAVTFNVLKEAEVAADVFVMAEVPKTSVYIGEGVVVRYYLYHKTPVRNVDIKKYPKLNGFLKRFLQEPERSERVSVDGQLYIRTQLYAAKLFPEKVGELKVDPLELSATVTSHSPADPFGTFGFGSGTTRQRTLRSESVKMEVKPVPEMGKPDNFIGLVGKHEIELQTGTTRLIVNEPLELKLTITGDGALENLEAPELLKHPDLEEFETNGDLKIMDAEQATKVFDFTFLPKNNLTLPARTISLSYFDPDANRYVPVQLNLPEIVVAGASAKERPKKDPVKNEAENSNKLSIPQLSPKLGAPIITELTGWRNWLGYLNAGLAIIALVIALGLVVKRDKLPRFSKTGVPGTFRKGEFSLSDFTKWMTPLIAKTGKSPITIIKDSELSDETKTYFIDLLQSNDYKDYSHQKGQLRFSYDAKRFRELDKYIQSVTYEDPSQPT